MQWVSTFVAVTMLGLAATEAAAISMEPDPHPGWAYLTLIGSTNGVPAGGAVVDGSVGSGDVTLIFQLYENLDFPVNFTLFELQGQYALGSPVTPTITGGGWIPGPDGDLDVPESAIGPTGFNLNFVDGIGPLGVERSDPFFLSFATSPVGAEMDLFTLSFGVPFADSITFVPESSVALPLFMGLAVIVLVRELRRPRLPSGACSGPQAGPKQT